MSSTTTGMQEYRPQMGQVNCITFPVGTYPSKRPTSPHIACNSNCISSYNIPNKSTNRKIQYSTDFCFLSSYPGFHTNYYLPTAEQYETEIQPTQTSKIPGHALEWRADCFSALFYAIVTPQELHQPARFDTTVASWVESYPDSQIIFTLRHLHCIPQEVLSLDDGCAFTNIQALRYAFFHFRLHWGSCILCLFV